jgi:hypothetical protein
VFVLGSEENWTEAEKEKLLSLNVLVSAGDLDLGNGIESAKECMGINDDTKVFSSDILRLELSGPEQPHLTCLDCSKPACMHCLAWLPSLPCRNYIVLLSLQEKWFSLLLPRRNLKLQALCGSSILTRWAD